MHSSTLINSILHLFHRSIYIKVALIFILSSTITQACYSQSIKTVLPESSYFEPIILDPLESQIFCSVLKRYDEKIEKQGYYAPFGIGGKRILFKNEKNKNRGWEIGIEAVALCQFEFVTDKGKWRRNILNSDYKIGIPLVWKLDSISALRLRMYHLSSHEGDDYIFINGRRSLIPNHVNYELVELHYSKYLLNTRLYIGAGINPRIETLRKRLAFQIGFHKNTKISKTSKLKLFYGSDIKIFEENKYSPNIKAALGLELGKEKPARLLLEYYKGNLPYSMYESIHTQWLGLGLYMLI